VLRALWVFAICAVADVSRAQQAASPAAPPRKCEVRQAAWCIGQGAWEITDRLAGQEKYDHVWIVRGFTRPKAPLVVLEPGGCREGYSDGVSAVRFDRAYPWDGKTWNRMVVRLRNDGSCDLDVLIPEYEDDATAEAFFSGLILLRNCTGASCDGTGFSRLAARWDAEYRGKQGAP